MVEKWSDLAFFINEQYLEIAKKIDPKKTVPKAEDIFRAFELTPFQSVKVVILGQDPYHTPTLADGLAFSVPRTSPTIPPSLQNIFKEMSSDLRIPIPTHGDLSGWAKQGVLLLNTSLTTEVGKPNAHKDLGWDKLVKEVLTELTNMNHRVVFVLWGSQARGYLQYIGDCPAVVSAHPSPLGASAGFWGSKPFSRVNNYLRSMQLTEIDWRLP